MSIKPVNKEDKNKKEEETEEDIPVCKSCTEEAVGKITTYKMF
ncbi:MAG: hypothetical protein ACXABJ_07025 [Candidatus Heimdallarchaeaceae archaeon]|jgi:hypothetical protein